MEMKRLNAIEKATLRRCGIETDLDMLDEMTSKVELEMEYLSSLKGDIDETATESRNKKRKVVKQEAISPGERIGCQWQDMSCAYDCVFMVFWNIFIKKKANRQWMSEWKSKNRTNNLLCSLYARLYKKYNKSLRATDMNIARDTFRNELSSKNPQNFPPGSVAIAVNDIFDKLSSNNEVILFNYRNFKGLKNSFKLIS